MSRAQTARTAKRCKRRVTPEVGRASGVPCDSPGLLLATTLPLQRPQVSRHHRNADAANWHMMRTNSTEFGPDIFSLPLSGSAFADRLRGLAPPSRTYWSPELLKTRHR